MPQRGAWKTADLLSLISGEMVTANHMRQNPFEFRSRAAVLATGNHAPLAPSSSGYWRRLRLADCRHQIPDEKQDDTLRAKLKQEAGRILQWALDAPQEVPCSPAEMLMAAESLRADQDPAGEWIDDHYVSDPKGTTTSAEAYMRYTDAVGEKGQPVARRTFDRLMGRSVRTDTSRVGRRSKPQGASLLRQGDVCQTAVLRFLTLTLLTENHTLPRIPARARTHT